MSWNCSVIYSHQLSFRPESSRFISGHRDGVEESLDVGECKGFLSRSESGRELGRNDSEVSGWWERTEQLLFLLLFYFFYDLINEPYSLAIFL